MSDDTTFDVTDEPDVDPEDQDVDQQDDGQDPDDDVTDEPDAAELKTRLTEAEAEAARYKRRLIASDTRKKQVEKELRDLRAAKPAPKTDEADQQTQRQPDDGVERELADLRRQVQESKVRAAFDGYRKYDWANPNAAWRLLDLDDVRQDDGTVDVDDLHDAVDRLAKDNEFLLKTPDKPAPRGERPTGQQPGQHRRQTKPDYSKTFRALRGRV